MFMSIRTKLSISFIVMILIFMVLFLLSFLYFYRHDYQIDISREQQKNEKMLSTIILNAGKLTNEDEIENYLAENTDSDIKIELFDTYGKSIWTGGKTSFGMKLSAKDYVIQNGNINYTIRLYRTIKFNNGLIAGYGSKYLWIIIILFLALFLVVAAFLNISIVRPIITLHNRMDGDPLKLKINIKNYRNDEIGMLESSFYEMVKRLQVFQRQQSNMLAAISHDLKTPLTSIITYTDRLSTGKVNDEKKQKHYYQVIGQKADDIRKLIDKFQDAAKVADRETPVDLELTSAANFYRETFEPYTEEWSDVDAILNYEENINENIFIKIDKSALRRVLINIIDNAIKYGARPLLINARIFKRQDYLVLQIENNGSQVNEDMLSLLFDRFYRIEPSRSKESGGSGLGLYICREIIEKHGGQIKAYKPWNNDFGIEISLPIEKSL